MPFARSSLQTIVDRIISDFQSRITGATNLLRRSTLRVIARIMAGAIHLLYEYLDYQARQLFVSTADEAGLEAIASEYGIARTAATQATGVAVATGTNTTVIPANSQLRSAADEFYETTVAATISGGVASLTFRAMVSGADGNDEPSISLSFVSPVIGVDTTVTVSAAGITGGSDIETDDALRTRVLARKRQPPHGGASFDYENWALEVSGVTRAWVFPQYAGVGTIGIAFVRDNDTTIIPNSTQRDLVEDYIVEHEDPVTGLTVGCPVTAEPGLTMIELTELVINLTIAIYPNTSAVQEAIEDELFDLIEREGGPGETIYLSEISEAISAASGEERHSLTVPAADVSAANTQIHVLGTITFLGY